MTCAKQTGDSFRVPVFGRRAIDDHKKFHQVWTLSNHSSTQKHGTGTSYLDGGVSIGTSDNQLRASEQD